jgi:hypothetical protein
MGELKDSDHCLALKAGLEKTRVKKKTSPVSYFELFWVLFIYLPRRESF